MNFQADEQLDEEIVFDMIAPPPPVNLTLWLEIANQMMADIGNVYHYPQSPEYGRVKKSFQGPVNESQAVKELMQEGYLKMNKMEPLE